MDQVLQEWQERVSAAARQGQALRLRGGGSKDWYGQQAHGELFDTRAWRGIVDYEPSELVVTARCGTPLAELERELAAQGQMLAFEPPHFGPGATVGGMVASGLSGPRRQCAGAVRDFVLGAHLMNGSGETLRFGGQVMKNVAGYDVSRLLAGSLGTLGLLLQVSLKVLPRPVAETTLRFALPQDEALRSLNAWGGQALPLSASVWHDGVLTVRLSGAGAAVRAARIGLGGEEFNGAAYWAGLCEQTDAFFDEQADCALWRLSVPTNAAPLALPGSQLIEWGGAQRWLHTEATAAEVRAEALRLGGHATLYRHGDKAHGVFHPLPAPLAALHRRLKTSFDPAGVFNRGRMYPDF
ncbi:MAG: glycolate oxidase subunit GlcE [Pseudomonadota bacterium]